jgi:hypothetical protein
MYRWHAAIERLFEGGTFRCLKDLDQALLGLNLLNRTPEQVSMRILQAASSVACKREWNGSLAGTTSNCRNCFELQVRRLTRLATLEPALITGSLTQGLIFPGSVSGNITHLNPLHAWPLVHLMSSVGNSVMPAVRSYTVSSPFLDAEAELSARRDIDPWPKEIKLQKKGKVRSCGCQHHCSLLPILSEKERRSVLMESSLNRHSKRARL